MDAAWLWVLLAVVLAVCLWLAYETGRNTARDDVMRMMNSLNKKMDLHEVQVQEQPAVAAVAVPAYARPTAPLHGGRLHLIID
jgi:hypothetical protein